MRLLMLVTPQVRSLLGRGARLRPSAGRGMGTGSWCAGVRPPAVSPGSQARFHVRIFGYIRFVPGLLPPSLAFAFVAPVSHPGNQNNAVSGRAVPLRLSFASFEVLPSPGA